MTARRFPDAPSTVEIDARYAIRSLVFAEGAKQVLSGGGERKLRRWRVNDGGEVGEPIQSGGIAIYATALSPDGKWLVCGLKPVSPNDGKANVEVWNAQTHQKVFDIRDHKNTVYSVDISADSTTFATGSRDRTAFIWSMTTGEQLVGPLRHDGYVVAVHFSPNGDHRIATTAVTKDWKTTSVRIYNSDSGQLLLDLPSNVSESASSASLAWSADARQLFVALDGEVESFDASSGSSLSKWSIPGGYPIFIALAHNQKFIVVSTCMSVTFWDTSTHKQIGTTLKHTSTILSTALSSNDDHVAVGEKNGKVTLMNPRDILPGANSSVNVSDPTHIKVGEFTKSCLSSVFLSYRECSNTKNSLI